MKIHSVQESTAHPGKHLVFVNTHNRDMVCVLIDTEYDAFGNRNITSAEFVGNDGELPEREKDDIVDFIQDRIDLTPFRLNIIPLMI